MSSAIEEMAAMDIVADEVETLLWKYGHDLSERDIKKALNQALVGHLASIKEFANKPRQKE